MLKDILSISGYGGLYKFISQGRNGIIVESLLDKKRMHAYATSKISSLEDIAIFTDDDEVPLIDVLQKIKDKEDGGPAINHKSSANELKAYFVEILPDYDKERVYVSDIKKVINWYNTLQSFGMTDFETKEEESDEETQVNDKEKAPKEEAKEQKSEAKEAKENTEKKSSAEKKKDE